MVLFADLASFLDQGTYFVPEDVGLEHPGEEWPQVGCRYPTEDDHPWCELSEDGFSSTDECGEVRVTDIVECFRVAHALGWPGGDREAS